MNARKRPPQKGEGSNGAKPVPIRAETRRHEHKTCEIRTKKTRGTRSEGSNEKQKREKKILL